jgi:hypothetical protein
VLESGERDGIAFVVHGVLRAGQSRGSFTPR